jgi:hypothetical protein
MIYLASPYSNPDPTIRGARFVAVCRATGALLAAGAHVLSPIASSHTIALYCNLPAEFDFWAALDHDIIDRCDEVWVLCLDGWDSSVGVTNECEYARSRGKTIRFIDPADPTQPLRQP